MKPDILCFEYLKLKLPDLYKKKKKIEERRLEIPNLKQGKKKPDPQI